MSTFIFANDASSTLAGPISSTALSVTLASGTGALFPNPGAGQQFAMTFNDAATGLLTEIVYCSARSGDTITIARGQEGTTAQSWSAGDLAANLITAGQMDVMFQSGTYQGQPIAAYLEYVSATSIKLAPSGGDTIIIDGLLFTLPNTGLTSGLSNVYVNGVSGQSLAASTVYDVFVFNNSGTLTFDFWSTGGHITDTSTGNVGIEVRNNGGVPDSTRTYVGKIAMNAVPQFQPQGTGVISWLNRKAIAVDGPGAAGPYTTSGGLAEITTTARQFFLTFGIDAVTIIASAVVSNNTANSGAELGISLDGTVKSALPAFISPAINVSSEPSTAAFQVPAEGRHYISPMGAAVNGGTASYSQLATAVVVSG